MGNAHPTLLEDDRRFINSRYLEWFHEETYGIHKKQAQEIIHYAFVTPNDVVDVLAEYSPIFG